MDTYVPRSRRLGLNPENAGPFEGIPEHLEPQLRGWASYMLGEMRVERVQELALQLRVAVAESDPAWDLMEATTNDPDLMWDVVETILHEGDIHNNMEMRTHAADVNRAEVRRMLDLAGSVYTVTDDGLIERRVIDEAAKTYAHAVKVEDSISDQLRQAWRHAYGLHPDASDAWDHAIKAVEAMLYPVVSPNNPKATLGTMLATLKDAGHKYRGAYLGPNRDHSVEYVVPLLQVIWGNPDRHASGATQDPTLEEARAVVTLVAALVQIYRNSDSGLIYLAPQNPAAS